MNSELLTKLKEERATTVARLNAIDDLIKSFSGGGANGAAKRQYKPRAPKEERAKRQQPLFTAIVGVLRDATTPLTPYQVHGSLMMKGYDFAEYAYPLKAIASTLGRNIKNAAGAVYNEADNTFMLLPDAPTPNGSVGHR